MAISVAICEIFSVKEWCDLENRVRVCSRSLEMAPFDRSLTSSYLPSIVIMAISCIVWRYSDLLIENQEIFIPHLYLAPPQGVTPSEFREDVLMPVKLEWLGYCMVKKLWRYDELFSSDTRTSRTDGRTDSQREILYQYRASVCWRAIKTLMICLAFQQKIGVWRTDGQTSWQSSSSSRMRVIYHNWSATKQRPHPQSVAEISRHSVLSGDRIRQCETSSCHGIVRAMHMRRTVKMEKSGGSVTIPVGVWCKSPTAITILVGILHAILHLTGSSNSKTWFMHANTGESNSIPWPSLKTHWCLCTL